MSDLRDLYQEVILDHNKRPRNKGTIEDATHTAEGHNPLCGDQITLRLKVKDGVVEEAKFEGHGCAISTASASLMTEAIVGQTVEEAHSTFERFHNLITGDGQVQNDYDPLSVLAGIKEYPMRVKCATLAWHTLDSALSGKDTVTSE